MVESTRKVAVEDEDEQGPVPVLVLVLVLVPGGDGLRMVVCAAEIRDLGRSPVWRLANSGDASILVILPAERRPVQPQHPPQHLATPT